MTKTAKGNAEFMKRKHNPISAYNRSGRGRRRGLTVSENELGDTCDIHGYSTQEVVVAVEANQGCGWGRALPADEAEDR